MTLVKHRVHWIETLEWWQEKPAYSKWLIFHLRLNDQNYNRMHTSPSILVKTESVKLDCVWCHRSWISQTSGAIKLKKLFSDQMVTVAFFILISITYHNETISASCILYRTGSAEIKINKYETPCDYLVKLSPDVNRTLPEQLLFEDTTAK